VTCEEEDRISLCWVLELRDEAKRVEAMKL
jgi:hypothetical protein